MAGIGAFEAILTAAGIFLVWRTLRASWAARDEAERAADAAEKSVKVARNIGRAQVRAYLSCSDSTYFVHSSGITVWPRFKNSGQSPTRRISVRGNLTISWGINTFGKGQTCGVGPIQSGQEGNGMLTFDDIPEAAIQAVLEGGGGLSVRGIVEWTDVFKAVDHLAYTLLTVEPGARSEDGRELRGSMVAVNKMPIVDGKSVDEEEPHEDG